MVTSRHTTKRYLNDKNFHKAINETLLKTLNKVEKDLLDVELLKSTIQHKYSVIVGFFILQCEKLKNSVM